MFCFFLGGGCLKKTLQMRDTREVFLNARGKPVVRERLIEDAGNCITNRTKF